MVVHCSLMVSMVVHFVEIADLNIVAEVALDCIALVDFVIAVVEFVEVARIEFVDIVDWMIFL